MNRLGTLFASRASLAWTLLILASFAPTPQALAQTPAPSPGAERSATKSDPAADTTAPSADASAKKGESEPATKASDGGADSPSAAAASESSATKEPAGNSAEGKGTSGPSWVESLASSGALGYMLDGGFFMWPILLLGVLAAGVIIERTRSLKMLKTDTSALRQEVQKLLQEERVEEALRICDREQGPVPAILASGLRKYLVLRKLNYDPARIEEQVVKGMDDYSVHIVAALERHLPILATVSSVAPMLGFLGTVQGMVVSFDDIVSGMGTDNIVKLAAAGIKVSLLTTVLGLIVGIPAFTAFNYFTSVINRFVLEVEESASELIETVTLQLAMNRQP